MEILTTVNMKTLILMMEAVISPETLIMLRLNAVTSSLEKIYNQSRNVRHDQASVELLVSLFQSRNFQPTFGWYYSWALTSNVAVKFVI